MGIPNSPEDIGTYDDLIKRLEENREFRVKVLKNDTEKFLRVDYKDEQYIVQILIEELKYQNFLQWHIRSMKQIIIK